MTSQNQSSLQTERARWLPIALAVFLVVTLYALGGTFIRDFAKNTEADRALIAWEMLDRGNNLVPYLLGDVYLTKPPLYYLFLKWSFQTFNSTAPWVARTPSALWAGALAGGTFLFLVRTLGSIPFALGGAFMLALTPFFYRYASLAEIDMTFGAICGLALYAFFNACTSTKGRTITWAFCAGILSGLAFLVKGPQLIVMQIAAIGGLMLFTLFQRKEHRESDLLPSNIILASTLLFFVAGSLIALWFLSLGLHVGFYALWGQFQEELLQRVVSDRSAGERSRGVLYYWYTLPLGTLPWSLGCLSLFRKSTWEKLKNTEKTLIVFLGSTLVASLVIFSLASGKSARYIFPLTAPLIVLSLIGWRYFNSLNWCLLPMRIFSLLLGTTCIVAAGVLALVYNAAFLTVLSLLAATAFLISASLATSTQKLMPAVSCLFIGLLLTRAPAQIHALTQNDKFQAPAVAKEIAQILPENATVYTVGMFERWIVFYIRNERPQDFLRLTPQMAREFCNSNGLEWVMLSMSTEKKWRDAFHQLSPHTRTTVVNGNYRSYALQQVPHSLLCHARLSHVFPTTPWPYEEPYSEPYGEY